MVGGGRCQQGWVVVAVIVTATRPDLWPSHVFLNESRSHQITSFQAQTNLQAMRLPPQMSPCPTAVWFCPSEYVCDCQWPWEVEARVCFCQPLLGTRDGSPAHGMDVYMKAKIFIEESTDLQRRKTEMNEALIHMFLTNP
jgi:hypothetical protein